MIFENKKQEHTPREVCSSLPEKPYNVPRSMVSIQELHLALGILILKISSFTILRINYLEPESILKYSNNIFNQMANKPYSSMTMHLLAPLRSWDQFSLLSKQKEMYRSSLLPEWELTLFFCRSSHLGRATVFIKTFLCPSSSLLHS